MGGGGYQENICRGASNEYPQHVFVYKLELDMCPKYTDAPALWPLPIWLFPLPHPLAPPKGRTLVLILVSMRLCPNDTIKHVIHSDPRPHPGASPRSNSTMKSEVFVWVSIIPNFKFVAKKISKLEL